MPRITIGCMFVALSVTLSVAPVAADDACAPRLLVLSAFPGEIDMLITEAAVDETREVDGRRFFSGTLRGNDVILALTGIGLINAEQTARAALNHFRCGEDFGIDGIVFSGVSGGRSNIGDVAVPRRWTHDNGQTWVETDAEMLEVARSVVERDDVALIREVPVGDPACVGADPRAAHTVTVAHEPQIIVGGDGRSSDPFDGRRFPCTPGGGDVFGCEPCRAPAAAAPDVARYVLDLVPFIDPAFFSGYFDSPPSTVGMDAEDMETAAVARVAAEAEIPFIAFRALSDGNGDPLGLPGFPFQFFYYRQLAADNAAVVTLAFLTEWAGR